MKHRQKETSQVKTGQDLSPQENLNKERPNLENLELVVQEVKNLYQEGYVGGNWTHLAIKDPKDYMIGTSTEGVKLVKGNTEIYSGKLPPDDLYLLDITYAPCTNCYFLASRDKLYRKDINNRPPYFYMAVKCGLRPGAFFSYSHMHKRLIVCKNGRSIGVINPKTKKVELVMGKYFRGLIEDFKLFGKHENRVVSVTGDGNVILYSLNFGRKRGIVSKYQVELLLEERNEVPLCLAVCSRNEYVILETGQDKRCTSIASRMFLFKLSEKSLVKMASLDQFEEGLGYKFCLECLSSSGNHILWIGLSIKKNEYFQVFHYDIENQSLVEVVSKRVKHGEHVPCKLNSMQGKYYYTGYCGKLMCLCIF